MKTNKGMTLIEVLVSVAILGIVLLGVSSMMRSGSILFLKGSNESNLQSEAQIVLNQIETIVQNANISINCLPGQLKIESADNKSDGTAENYTYNIVFNSGNPAKAYDGKLYFSKLNSSGVYIDKDVLMAEYMKLFTIDKSKLNTENKITVTVEMENQDASYVGSREIYLRNQIGNKVTADDIPATSNPGNPSDYEYEVFVNRCGAYDLDKMFGFTIDEAAYNANHANVFTEGSTSYIYDATTKTVKLSAGFTGTAAALQKTASGMIVGEINHVQKKIKLTTKAVDFSPSTGTNYLYMDTSTSYVRNSFSKVQGISFSGALNDKESVTSYSDPNLRIKYKVKWYYLNGTGKKYTTTAINTEKRLAKKTTDNTAYDYSFTSDGKQYSEILFKVFGDPDSDDLAIQQTSQAKLYVRTDNPAYNQSVKDGKSYIEVEVNIYNSSDGLYYTDTIDFQIKELRDVN